ncbi:Dolichyl-phosphate-mannose-protein mannosyltransferase [Pedobacter westerhofensis]|uniref:Dolichyl-phosphate-mannose-protein mannosyltransferase n=1 Tax=Pedobacter westerhofensis TaxID=425512 RepID=A0A521AG82_9SPHI|nr:glycosyltransferase family 39 protein [Pedobacter westerhofensis]SMO33834.1 Dolichyl-phosphate-mannose-protein mannosyltransferase [Pedobacter westerhofensis]
MTKRTTILTGFILVKFLLQYFLVNPSYDLHRDEFLHLDQANHPAWGYLSVPPVTSWISYLIQLLGSSIFWVKFFPALFGALTILVVWKTIEELKGNLYALILGATCLLLSVLLRLNFLYQPNSLDVLCWAAMCFCIIRYFNREDATWLFLASVVFAIGFLNKYNIVFLLLGLLPALAVTNQRRIFSERNFYLSVLLTLALISPNLYWQYNHHFPVFQHMRELIATQLIHVNRWDFIKEQIFYFAGSLPAIIAALYGLLIYPPFRKYRFFFWTFIFTPAIFIFLRAKGYYAIGLYPVYIAFGSVYLGNILNRRYFEYLKPLPLALPLVLYALLFHVYYSIEDPEIIIKNKNKYRSLGLLRWEDGRNHQLPQDFADMLGWKELARKAERAYHLMPKGSQTIVLCDNYGQAGAINYYVKDKSIKAVSFNADYINWFNLRRKTNNVIRVKEYSSSQNELKETGGFFRRSAVADSVKNPMARECGTTIFVFEQARIDVNQRLRSEIEEERK